eukprot:scaffold4635_cov242-Prasinococcus_capsulatus_cf.AAC.1
MQQLCAARRCGAAAPTTTRRPAAGVRPLRGRGRSSLRGRRHRCDLRAPSASTSAAAAATPASSSAAAEPQSDAALQWPERSVYCGEVGEAQVGASVSLCGWVDRRRDLGGVCFVDLRDHTGVVQVVMDPAVVPAASKLRAEFVVHVVGEPALRPAAGVNAQMRTGAVEVRAASVTILSAVRASLPFAVGAAADPDGDAGGANARRNSGGKNSNDGSKRKHKDEDAHAGDSSPGGALLRCKAGSCAARRDVKAGARRGAARRGVVWCGVVWCAGAPPSEEVRLKHRVLDLRRPQMQRNLRLRHRVVRALRRFLEDEHGFVEVRGDAGAHALHPGGRPRLHRSLARADGLLVSASVRVVPHAPSSALLLLPPPPPPRRERERGRVLRRYALPQSPQLFKQMLMAAGYDRYYQVARCFRDEDLRADRQP